MHRHASYLNQIDPEDNLLSLKMLKEFIGLNSKSDKPVLFDKDVSIYLAVDGQRYRLTADKTEMKVEV